MKRKKEIREKRAIRRGLRTCGRDTQKLEHFSLMAEKHTDAQTWTRCDIFAQPQKSSRILQIY